MLINEVFFSNIYSFKYLHLHGAAEGYWLAFRLLGGWKISQKSPLCIQDLEIFRKKFKYNVLNNKKNYKPNGFRTGLGTLSPRQPQQQIPITDIHKFSIQIRIYVTIYNLYNPLF